VVAQERKAAKPNSDSIARSKKIWERLRRKSHVPKEERKALVTELFAIITGRVRDFVFKHDSVRVIQTAVKYANQEQRRLIAGELKGSYRSLAESRYAKFLIAKLVVGDNEIRDLVIPEFYGNVKKLIRHPEAAWIMDDIYRTIATPEQKARLLREWYGDEFVIFHDKVDKKGSNMDLKQLLGEHPEKRAPIMQHLKELTNHLVQQKKTGFTMLHDALLQYFLNCSPGGVEALEVLQTLRDDEDGECMKNLAFTRSGARLVCFALAYGGSKDRRTILKLFKGVMRMLASDANGHCVLLTAMDVVDDTVMTFKSIFPELLGKDLGEEERQQALLAQIKEPTSRIPLLYLFDSGMPRYLLLPNDIQILEEMHRIRETTSKKDAQIRRQELVKSLSQPLLELVKQETKALASTSFGCQFIREVIFGATGEKADALEAVASLAKDEPDIASTLHARRMLKDLVQGGPFDSKVKQVQPINPPLGFETVLYARCRDEIHTSWALGTQSFVVVALLESHALKEHDDLVDALRGLVPELEKACQGSEKQKGNAGATILLQKLKEL
jgi:pumilio homology domain family member 6